MSVDAPTERDMLLIAKQGLKPILAFVVGAFLTRPILFFLCCLEVFSIHLFGKISDDNFWKHFLFHYVGCSQLSHAKRLVFREFFDHVFGHDDGVDELSVLGFLFGLICAKHLSTVDIDTKNLTLVVIAWPFLPLFSLFTTTGRKLNNVNRRDAVNGSVHE